MGFKEVQAESNGVRSGHGESRACKDGQGIKGLSWVLKVRRNMVKSIGHFLRFCSFGVVVKLFPNT